jgi:hypothetical protein
MRPIMLTVTAAALLAGCNSSAPSGNTTTSTTTTTLAAAATGLKPGKWEHKVELLDVQSKNMPKQFLDGMRNAMSSTTSSCLTPEEAAVGPKALIERADLKKIHCRFDKAEMAGGTISTVMTCDTPGGTMTVNSTGTYSATEYSVDGAMTQTGRMDLSEKTRTTGRWVGECTAGDTAGDKAK